MFSADSIETGTSLPELAEWVGEIAELTKPDAVVWCDGSQAEWDRLTSLLVEAGTFTRLNPELRPNSFWCRLGPRRRGPGRGPHVHLLRSGSKTPGRPTTGSRRTRCARRSRRSSTGACGAASCTWCRSAWARWAATISQLGVEITDSPYVAVSMRIMTRMGTQALRAIEASGSFVRAVHSVGAPLAPGQARRAVAVQPGQVHLPLPRDPGDLVLRVGVRRERAARQEVLRAADRLGDGAGRGLAGRAHAHPQDHPARRASQVHRGGVPVRVRQDQPGHAGADHCRLDRSRPIGDDIAWMRFGPDGRLYAINPEAGFFGVAPGTGAKTNANAVATM